MNTNLVWNSQNSLYLQIFWPFHNSATLSDSAWFSPILSYSVGSVGSIKSMKIMYRYEQKTGFADVAD